MSASQASDNAAALRNATPRGVSASFAGLDRRTRQSAAHATRKKRLSLTRGTESSSAAEGAASSRSNSGSAASGSSSSAAAKQKNHESRSSVRGDEHRHRHHRSRSSSSSSSKGQAPQKHHHSHHHSHSHSRKRRGAAKLLPIGSGWYEGFDALDRKYYVHRKRRISQWDLPEELMVC